MTSLLHHVGFTVGDMDRSVQWYRLLLQAEPLSRGMFDRPYIASMVGYPGCRMECTYFPLAPSGMLELVQYLEPATIDVDLATYAVGNGHLCLEVADLDVEYRRLAGHAEFRSPAPVEITHGPNRGGRGCYLTDPDGITVQLMQRPAAPPPGGAPAA